jgi:hypothetical protein
MPVKKGLPVLAWAGIGCGGLLIVAIIAGVFIFNKVKKKFEDISKNPEKAAAELFISMNPEFEMISEDNDKGTMTIRSKSGEELTLSYKDISQGRFEVTDASGNKTSIGSADLSKVPAWVPMPPDLTDVASLFHTQSGSKGTGMIVGKSRQGAEALKAFFEGESSAKNLGTSTSTFIDTGDAALHTLKYSSNGRSLEIIITVTSGEPTQVNIHYSEG